MKQLLVVYLQLLSLLLQLVESESRLLDQVRRGHVGRRGSGGNEGLCYCSGLSGPSRSVRNVEHISQSPVYTIVPTHSRYPP